ncbi:MAG: AAA family ATPase, partial [Tepidisphaeraceae bacterium]
MSEYAGSGAAERLLGSDHSGPRELIKRLRRQPFSVVLLDEIEKAVPEVFAMLLGVFDAGRLTNSFGWLRPHRGVAGRGSVPGRHRRHRRTIVGRQNTG